MKVKKKRTFTEIEIRNYESNTQMIQPSIKESRLTSITRQRKIESNNDMSLIGTQEISVLRK